MGAMLAGVDYVLMGAGLPTYIPGVLDGLAKWEKVSMKLHVTGPKGASASTSFDPTKILPGKLPLQRPNFLAIISSEIVAKTMIKRSSGEVNGFVVENHTAGGHNAPPRKVKGVQADAFSDKDTIKIDAIAKLGKPFWLAGKFASPEKLKEAKDQGAIGVQIGTAFAFCDQSGIPAETRKEVLDQCKAGTIKIDTDFRASPTGYPFKVVRLDDAPKAHKKRQRVCDLGYLRSIHITEDEHTLYRCASEPIDHYLKKEGEVDEVLGRQCLCNALMSLIGHPQVRDGYNEPVIITAGSDVLEVVRFLKDGDSSYSADDVIDYILGESTKK